MSIAELEQVYCALHAQLITAPTRCKCSLIPQSLEQELEERKAAAENAASQAKNKLDQRPKLDALKDDVYALEAEARAAGLELDDAAESENGEGDDGSETRGYGMLMEVDTNEVAAP